MTRFLFPLVLLFVTFQLTAQEVVGLDYYLPQDVQYNPEIPTPKEVIGHEVGEWHVTHDKLLYYMRALAEASNRISLEERGGTYEGRPLALLTVTSPQNHGQLEQIRQQHIASAYGKTAVAENQPVVVYQGFSIHGNESSGSNAALAYAYYLAAAQGPAIDQLLQGMVILLDPAFNPDGLQRFSYWANTNKSAVINPDPNDREYHEVWPGGRTNHYWFDMNRDWLPVQLPESQARIATYHQWLPNVLTDHHEMGTNSSFFFQPGVPSRVNPLTPKENQTLTGEIASYHIKALDKLGSLYYSEEDFDDFYYGKGSTFPDVNGGIGILFEQGSSRGHAQESENGILTFPFTIRNQFTTALSTIEAAQAMRNKLLTYQHNFYKNAQKEAGKAKSIVFGAPKDPARAWHLAEILERHQIRFNKLKDATTLDGKSYEPENSFVIPLNQEKYKLIQAMFNTQTTFKDSLFYDISAWTFPLAFNLNYGTIGNASAGANIDKLEPIKGTVSGPSNYAYLFAWDGYYTPKALNQILDKGIRAKVATSPFTLGEKAYDYGTIMIPVKNQKLSNPELYRFLQEVAAGAAIDIDAVGTGHTQGIDLGSNRFESLKKQQVALLVGDGITSYDAGEIWHLFDQRYQMKITKLDVSELGSTNLDRYTSLIVPNTSGRSLGKNDVEKIKGWVRNGGTLIGYRNTAHWLKKQEFLSFEEKQDSALVAKDIAFDERRSFRGAQVTGGAIFEAKLDRSHPINYGYSQDLLPLFRNTNIYLEADKHSYNNPIQYTDNPLLSGYISEENAALIKNSVPFKVNGMGRGQVILFTDNTNFRAFWYGTNKLLMNAIFFGEMM